MQEIIQAIMNKIDKKGIQSDCKKILKKCSFKSDRDVGWVTELSLWLYVYGYYDEAVQVADILKDIEFTGDYTLWSNVDHALCLKARILRERGEVEESREIIQYVNQYRSPEKYKNLVDWFLNTLETNIESNLKHNSKSGAKSWRLLKLETAIAYREAGQFPVSDKKLEDIISSLVSILKLEK